MLRIFQVLSVREGTRLMLILSSLHGEGFFLPRFFFPQPYVTVVRSICIPLLAISLGDLNPEDAGNIIITRVLWFLKISPFGFLKSHICPSFPLQTVEVQHQPPRRWMTCPATASPGAPGPKPSSHYSWLLMHMHHCSWHSNEHWAAFPETCYLLHV